jgi:hypothetical protein
MKLVLSLLLVVAGCSFKKNLLENQTSKGHQELYTEPEEPKLQYLEKDEKRIVIASTNDLHGKYETQILSFSDDQNKKDLKIRIGGRKVIKNHFDILRETYKNVVLVDSGDVFSSADQIKDVSQFYQSNNYDAVTVGLRDFNLKINPEVGSNTKLFQDFAKSSKVPLLLTNLYELKTARAVEWEGAKSHLIKEVNGVKVGIIGLIPDDIVAQTPVNNRVGLFVENMLQSTLRHARLLRSLGADVIVVLTHQGLDCSSELSSQTKLPLKKVNFDPQQNKICDLKNALGEYLERLPPQLVDVVIGGRTHEKMANFVNGTLVMSSFPDGKSFNYAEFVVNTKNNKIVPEKTIVHQPVFFCHEFFAETNDCFLEDSSVNHSKRIPAKFLGKPIEGEPLAATDMTIRKNYSLNSQTISRSLIQFKADLSYAPDSTGETQLFVMAIKGSDLIKILEEDYHLARRTDWWPSPYLLKDDELSIMILGLEIELGKTYRVLTDLESVQSHQILVKQVANYEAEALMNHSWASIDEDSVSSQLAAQTR